MAEISFPFLRLPTELRNKVYEFAVADTKSDDTCLFYKKDPQYGSKQYVREQYGGKRYGKGPEICSSSYLSLIKVCRQIRTEFRPLLCSAWNPVIGFRSFPKFLATFAPNAATTTFAKITMQIDEPDASGHETQLLWLLRARARATTWSFHLFRPTQMDQAMGSSMSTSTSSTSTVPFSTSTGSPSTLASLLLSYESGLASTSSIMSNTLSKIVVFTHCSFLEKLIRLENCGGLHSLPLDHFHALQIRGAGADAQWLLHYQNEANKPTAELSSRVMKCCTALAALFPQRRRLVGGDWVETYVGTVRMRLENSVGHFLVDCVWDTGRDAFRNVITPGRS